MSADAGTPSPTPTGPYPAPHHGWHLMATMPNGLDVVLDVDGIIAIPSDQQFGVCFCGWKTPKGQAMAIHEHRRGAALVIREDKARARKQATRARQAQERKARTVGLDQGELF
jgi:hypothetical protein